MKPTTVARIVNVLFFTIFIPSFTDALLRRCYVCRSRGDLGSCKDPFYFNLTVAEQQRGVQAAPCASGWCGKLLEGGNSFKDDEYGVATERICLQRGPSDNEERCDYISWNHKRVYMCFCQGDLCNGAPSVNTLTASVFILSVILSFTIAVT
ncbi:hypothetical protein L9F63_010067 [Diploptera punctata]|uniref:Protein sleepless n=1 Tax=Diploptera punctata TaxID=6984 RepID=A0AAD8AI24_DIPPU|nr:hypothetical protein L9F63_010067 [Diploptera punctata]